MLSTVKEGAILTDYAGLPRRIMELLFAHPDLEVSASHMLDIDPGLPRNSHNMRLKRMQEAGLVTSQTRKIQGERNRPRRFYRLTAEGLRELVRLRENYGLFPSRGDRYDVIPITFDGGVLSQPSLERERLTTLEDLERHKIRYAHVLHLMQQIPRAPQHENVSDYPRRFALLFHELGRSDFDGKPEAFKDLTLGQTNLLLKYFVSSCFKNSEELFQELQPDNGVWLQGTNLSPPEARKNGATPSATKPSKFTPQVQSVLEKYMQTVERHRQEERALLAELTRLTEETEPTDYQVEPVKTEPKSTHMKSPKTNKPRKRAKSRKNKRAP